jgi:hypothetical protein
MSELKDYSHLIGFLQSYYDLNPGLNDHKKAPTKKDSVRDARL